MWRDCQVKLTFKDFSAGQRYQLQAGSIGFRPWIKLYDHQQNWLARACLQAASAPETHKRRYAFSL